MNSKNTLAIFDFDGTITRSDSFVAFLKFCFGKKLYWKLLPLAPKLFLYSVKLYSNDVTKEEVLSKLFRDMSENEFEKLCFDFAEKIITALCKKSALEKMEWHRKENHELILLSASFEDYLKPWAEQFGFTVIATKVERKNNLLTGNFIGKNCNHEEKLIRLKSEIDLAQFEEIYAYGDTKGDEAFMSIATKKFFRNFD